MYEEFYKFSGKPFQLSPDARFFYNSSGHNRAMAYLRYGLRQGEGFIVITGGIGTGKTMLVSNLFDELDAAKVVAAQLVSTQVEADDALRMISASFGLAHEDLSKATLLRNLESFFRARRAEGKRILLVVDEAQNLPRKSIEELRMLSNFQDGSAALLQSFLIGQVELKNTLQGSGMEQVRQRIIAGYHLRPLDREEMQAYVEHRLSLVGWKGDPKITEGAFDALHECTGGIPRRINTLSDRILLFGALEEKNTIDKSHVSLVLDEVRQEVGYQSPDGAPADEAPHEAPAEAAPSGDLLARIGHLEKEIETLRRVVRKDHKLLKKALLMQLEMDSDDDF